MRRLLIGAGGVLIALLAVAIVTATPLVGEVVTLHSRSADGQWQTTPLWIVDADDGVYLRAGTPDGSGWVRRVQADAVVRLERGGELQQARLVPSPALRDAVNQRMADKYGWANGFVALLGDHAAALPFRVEPIDASGP